MNEYQYNEFDHQDAVLLQQDQEPLFLQHEMMMNDVLQQPAVDFDDPTVSSLPRVLLMGPRRGGKTSIQVLILI
jgi:hypothetical protein